MSIFNFKYGKLSLLNPDTHSSHLKEIFILDIYRANLLKEGDIVLDLGASTGEFSILASKKIGKEGKVLAIEPNADDFELLKENIVRNNCQNIIPMNLGVGNDCRVSEMTYHGKIFRFRVDTLDNILKELQINDEINFVKMDIEGSEVEVISHSIEIINKTRVISMELHGKDARKKSTKC